MSTKTKLDEIKGEIVTDDVFNGFTVKDTLVESDSPLLLVASDPKGSDWLFKWCDTLDGPDYLDRWIALEVSQARLHALKSGKLSLREALTLPEEELYYVLDAKELFEPVAIKSSSPEQLPIDYLPSDDMSIDGKPMRLLHEDRDRLAVRFHVFSKQIPEGKAPFSMVSPLQNKFQNYMAWAAHKIRNDPIDVLPDPLKDWASFNLERVAAGSFKMECISNSDREQSEKLSRACEVLRGLANGAFDNIELVRQQIGGEGLVLADTLADFVSKLGLSMSITWTSSGTPNGYLAIDRRRANNFLKALRSQEETRPTITITLTKKEVEPIMRPLTGQGGMQTLLAKLQSKLEESYTITLTDEDVERILRYGLNYGQGGFQGRLLGIAKVLQRVRDSLTTT